MYTNLVAAEETGQALNDAIFRRNRRMEERFGFTLVQTDFTGPGPVRDAARRSIQAASDDFDMAMMTPAHALSLAQENMLEMIDRMPHIDLTRPWWDQDMVRDLSIGGRVFFTTGDFSFNHYSVTRPILFNKQLHADLGLDCPYEAVHAGRWTLETMAEMGRAALRDLNGDGIFDRNDQFGYAASPDVIMGGIGARYIVKDMDDMPVLNINSPGFISRFHTVFDILSEPWFFDNQRHGISNVEDMFVNNQLLFWTPLLHRATALRAMETDFGILPTPKLNEQQEHYISGVGVPHVMSIPVTSADLERTGIILEALSAESRLTTRHVYFDTMLINQVLNRDEESAEMFEIIFANRVYELGTLYWGSAVTDPIIAAFREDNRDIVSVIERHEAAALAAIEATVAAFLEN